MSDPVYGIDVEVEITDTDDDGTFAYSEGTGDGVIFSVTQVIVGYDP